MKNRILHHSLMLFITVCPVLSLPIHAETTVESENFFGAVYTDEHPGAAGYPRNTHENTYYFNVTKASGKAVVLVKAKKPPRPSIGEVRLLTEGNSFLIGSWNQQKFPGDGLRFDVGKYVTKPGKYEVRFIYRGGPWGLEIEKVQIDTRR